jgi:uncharacterized membrane protein YuzA (DUF378 family)
MCYANTYFCAISLFEEAVYYMKYSQQIGFIAALALIGICFLPWSFIHSQQITVSGVSAVGTSYGKPGLVNIFFSSVMILFFLLPKIWAKRTNVFISAFNLAWAIRNYILVSTCMFGECPEKKPALYALVALAAIMQLMTFFPTVNIEKKK